MRYPRFLQEGGTVGCPAPSFGCATEPYRSSFFSAQRAFQERGYQVVAGPNALRSDGIGISAPPRECGEEFQEMYLHGPGDVLISCGGGELMCEILDHIDFDAIRAAEPKWLMGYSDNTNLTFLLTTLCDTASIYGPCIGTFGMEPWHESVTDALDLLRGRKLTMTGYARYEVESLRDETHPLAPYHVTEPRIIRANMDPTRFSGRLVGGCLDCLVNLAGTCYDQVEAFSARYEKDGIIWFLEACDLNPFSIRRALWELDHAGWFRHVKGFLVGRPLCMGQEMMGLDQYKAVLGVLEKYQVPILMDLDIGHIPPMMPLISGAMAQVSYENQALKIEMSLE